MLSDVGERFHPPQPVTTVAKAATSPETARTPGRRGNRSATTVGSVDTWPATATPMSRSATPVAALDTSRNAARKSNATGDLLLLFSLKLQGNSHVKLASNRQLTAHGKLMAWGLLASRTSGTLLH